MLLHSESIVGKLQLCTSPSTFNPQSSISSLHFLFAPLNGAQCPAQWAHCILNWKYTSAGDAAGPQWWYQESWRLLASCFCKWELSYAHLRNSCPSTQWHHCWHVCNQNFVVILSLFLRVLPIIGYICQIHFHHSIPILWHHRYITVQVHSYSLNCVRLSIQLMFPNCSIFQRIGRGISTVLTPESWLIWVWSVLSIQNDITVTEFNSELI